MTWSHTPLPDKTQKWPRERLTFVFSAKFMPLLYDGLANLWLLLSALKTGRFVFFALITGPALGSLSIASETTWFSVWVRGQLQVPANLIADPRAGPPGDACLKYISGSGRSFASRPERLGAYKGMRILWEGNPEGWLPYCWLPAAIVGTRNSFLFFFFPVGGCK